MIKKLLICLVGMYAISFMANAQNEVTGTYTGQLEVTVHITGEPEKGDPITSNIILTKEDGKETYALSIKDFNFSGIPVGDLNVTEITITQEEGFFVLSKEGYSVAVIPDLMTVYIYLGGGTIDSNGKMEELELTVFSAPGGGNQALVAEVLFNGNRQATGIFNPKSSSLAIHISADFSTINTSEQNGNYAIISATGAVMQSGNVENGTIYISNLKTGVYMIRINDSVAKFIKK